MEITSTLITLIVATVELVVCLFCAIVLWRQRRGMPDRSRLMLALGAAHCVVTSSGKLLYIIASPTAHPYQELLPPDFTMWHMLSMLLILVYPVTVVRPEWFRSLGGIVLFLSPGLLFAVMYICVPSYHHLYSLQELGQQISEPDVLLRALQYPVIFGYSLVLLFFIVNIRKTGASSLWLRSYIIETLGLLTLASAFSTTHLMPLHYLHQLCVAAFYGYWTYYELMERVYTAPAEVWKETSQGVPGASLPPSSDEERQRFLRFDEQVEQRLLYAHPGISRDDLCRVMGADRTTFSRIIAEHSGCQNLADYLNQKRMRHADRLMRELPHYSIEAIMQDCGYQSKTTFNRVFKDYYGTTPSDYRKSLPPAVPSAPLAALSTQE